ncbi:MAG: hypothetical protein QME05_01000 [Candidatus Margulisbacteria bacterium]|nr:hypothetical protein [Candidatus Margulisiibacteriota bacterium]
MQFELTDQFHRNIRLSKERFDHVLEHPEMVDAEQRIKESILVPDIIKQSKHDAKVWLYYKLFPKTPVTTKYLSVIIKVLNGQGFTITAYYTNKVKEGKTIWQR